MKRILLAAAVSLAAASSLAVAHKTGHEARTVDDCKMFPKPERDACTRCVSQPAKHYHPEYPAGARCRPDNDQP